MTEHPVNPRALSFIVKDCLSRRRTVWMFSLPRIGVLLALEGKAACMTPPGGVSTLSLITNGFDVIAASRVVQFLSHASRRGGGMHMPHCG